jgi:cytochrome c-type biogenesis protein CcmE
VTIAPPAGPGTPPVAATPNPPAPGRGRSHRLRYVGVGVVLVAAFAFLLVKGLGSSLDYYLTVDQAVHQKASLGSRDFRLEGVVVPGTVHDTATGVDFTVRSNGVSAQVSNTTNPPQLFQPNIPVVVVGHFSGNVFDSNQILVKHSSSYVAAHPNRVTAPNGSKR